MGLTCDSPLSDAPSVPPNPNKQRPNVLSPFPIRGHDPHVISPRSRFTIRIQTLRSLILIYDPDSRTKRPTHKRLISTEMSERRSTLARRELRMLLGQTMDFDGWMSRGRTLWMLCSGYVGSRLFISLSTCTPPLVHTAGVHQRR